MSRDSTPASSSASRPASTIRSRSDLSCWILCGVFPIPRTPTRMTPPRTLGRSLVRLGLPAPGPAIVGAEGDGVPGDPGGGADGRRLGGDREDLGDPLARTVAEGQELLP